MNRLFTISLLVLFACSLVFVGCDSGDDAPEPDQIVGMWEATEIGVSVATPFGSFPVPVYETGDQGTVDFDFDSDGTFAFTVGGPLVIDIEGLDPVEVLPEGATQTTRGTYEVSSDEIDFTATEVGGQAVPPSTSSVPFEFRGNDAFVLTIDNSASGRELLAFLIGDAVPAEVLDAIEGGEARFERAN